MWPNHIALETSYSALVRKTTPWGVWDHLPLHEVTALLRDLQVPWWVAGGFAIDIVAGSGRRQHDDVDIGIFADDQLALRQHLDGWDLHFADPPGTLQPWVSNERLAEHVHDIWVRRHADDPWRFQIMLNPGNSTEFVYRRDSRVRLPFDEGTHVVDGVRYLAPELQLLFKSRAPRAKDLEDFRDCLPALTTGQRQWLAGTLALVDPLNDWISQLATSEAGQAGEA